MKAMYLLLGAGVLLLAGAGIVLFMRGQDVPPAPEVQPIMVEPLADIPAPLTGPSTEPAVAVPAEDTGAEKKTSPTKKPVLTGTIDPKTVATFIDERFVLIKTCYERRLRINPMLQGKIDVNIGIAPNGSVTSVRKNSDSVQDREMWSCIKKTIRKWQFPKPEGGPVEVAKVFNFKKMN